MSMSMSSFTQTHTQYLEKTEFQPMLIPKNSLQANAINYSKVS